MIESIIVDDGKYQLFNENGRLWAERNGEPWDRDLTGDNLVYAMMVRILDLEAAAQGGVTKEAADKAAQERFAALMERIREEVKAELVTAFERGMGVRTLAVQDEQAQHRRLLAWAYTKLQSLHFRRQEDALMLDEINLLLQGVI